MEFEENRINDALIIKVIESRITADIAADFKASIIGYVDRGNRMIVLDLSDVAFIDSSGLGALIGCLKAIGDKGELVLFGAREAVVNMFKLTRMNKVFRMFDTEEEAISALS